ncbi:MAG: polyprenyl diphosphate synthase [Synergistaceae bacterium]|nr:polyprenyl diphosphate synthase [Synergistaceae bacterium]
MDRFEIIPAHLAIVLDGNGRWAKERGWPRLMGHRSGLRNLEATTKLIKKYGIRYFSVYAFSTENWNRPFKEIEGLMSFFRHYIRNKVSKVYADGGRIRFAGRRDRLPNDLVKMMVEAEERTKDADIFDLILCIDYGGRTEIIDAVNSLISGGKTLGGDGKFVPISETDIRGNLYLPDVPDPDLIIRTSGEFRTSNFWLWESSYSEYYFTDVYWPDFNEAELVKALKSYEGRDRRYGSVKK